MSASLFKSLQELQVDAQIELWTVDNSAKNGAIYRFHGQDQTGTDSAIEFDGQTYEAAPIEVTGIKQTSNGNPNPKLTIAKRLAVNLGLLVDPNLLLDATCTRVKTLAQYLPQGSSPDPTAVYPSVSFHIERLEVVTDQTVVYVLSDPTALPDVKLPGQTVHTNLCAACYRGPSCQYAGPPVTSRSGALFGPTVDRGTWDPATAYAQSDRVDILNPEGTPFAWVALQAVPAGIRPASLGADLYWELDSCASTISACKLRFDEQTEGLNFDNFPGASRVPSS